VTKLAPPDETAMLAALFDVIGGSVLRAAASHGLEAPATQALVDGIRAGEP
jgi:hypothetical protein